MGASLSGDAGGTRRPIRSSGAQAPPLVVERDPKLAAALTTVYATRTGEKYHQETCRHLSKSKIRMELKDAAVRYGPCSVCRPGPPVFQFWRLIGAKRPVGSTFASTCDLVSGDDEEAHTVLSERATTAFILLAALT